MTNRLPPIYFYLPQGDRPANLPTSADTYWSGFEGNLTSGVYAWTVQTYLRLKEDNFPCELIGTLPAEGIVLAHRRSLPFHLKPKSRLLIVCLKADYDRHPYAQLHVVLNSEEMRTVKNSYYIPHWPQPGLIPRSRQRGDIFENVAYFGIDKNLATELLDSSWLEQVNGLGLHWGVVSNPERWNDFSYVDAILAVRSFESTYYTNKPPTKLYNSWHAGVPAILGCESAYRAERKSELDYIEVSSVNDALLALARLRDDKELRHAMVENGLVRARETQPATILKRWRNFLTDVAVPAYERWCKASSWNRQTYTARCYLTIKENNLQPHSLYPHDTDIADNKQLGIQDWALISTMQLYRNLKRNVKKLGF